MVFLSYQHPTLGSVRVEMYDEAEKLLPCPFCGGVTARPS